MQFNLTYVNLLPEGQDIIFMKTRFITYFLLSLLLVSALFLIFKNLSDNYLWQDEAESAVLARNILHFGYPKAFDGLNLVNPNIYSGFGNGYAWKYHPWLHFYLISLSYKILGENAFSSRLPSAILGFLAIVIIFFLAKRLFKKDGIALLSVLLVTTSVPFLLLVRQCRYYSLQMFLVLAIIWAYLNVLEKNGKYIWQLGALFTALCYTNHGAFIPVFGSVIIHFFFVNKNRALRKEILIMCIAVISLALPWFIYSYAPRHIATLNPLIFYRNFEFQIRILNKYIFPLAFLLVLSWKLKPDPYDKRSLLLILVLLAVNLCFYTFVEQRTIRYYVHLLPFLYILEAYLLLTFLSKHKFLLFAFLFIIIFTNIFHNSILYAARAAFVRNDPEKRAELLKKVNFYFPMYIYEITHNYHGPLEGTVKFLKEHAKPGDTVKVPYDEASLIFYLPYLKIENGYFFDNKDFPDWIVWREYWINEYRHPSEGYDYKLYDDKYVRAIKSGYTAHVIPYPDIIWDNRPDDMSYHKFKTSDEPRKVIIYEKKRPF